MGDDSIRRLRLELCMIGIVLIVLVSMPLLSFNARAWGNGGYSDDQNNPDYGTHDWIANASLAIQTEDVTFLRSTYNAEFLLGTEAPDNPAYIGDTTKHHIYFRASQQLQDDICAGRASQIYQTALEYLLAGDARSAAFDIGVLTHYISDAGVFGHTMGTYTDWGSEKHHSDYENKFESMIQTLPLPTGYELGDSEAYNATLDLGRRVTFGDAVIQPNAWMDSNYNWSNGTFKASALASLNGSVAAVAAVINHLMTEASSALPSQVPQAPRNLAARVDDSAVILTWLAPLNNGSTDVTGYKIYRSTDPTNPSFLTSVSNSTLTWTDTSTEKGRTVYYWVAAENSAGTSSLSQVVSVDVPKKSGSMILPIVLSAISAALVSGGVLFWRRRVRRTPHS